MTGFNSFKRGDIIMERYSREIGVIEGLQKDIEANSADKPDSKIPGYIGIGNLFPLDMDKVIKNYPYPEIENT